MPPRFLTLTDEPDAVDLKVSELTREHLREVLRLFVATQPGETEVEQLVIEVITGLAHDAAFAAVLLLVSLLSEAFRSSVEGYRDPDQELGTYRRALDWLESYVKVMEVPYWGSTVATTGTVRAARKVGRTAGRLPASWSSSGFVDADTQPSEAEVMRTM